MVTTRPKRRRIKLVGGGYKFTRERNAGCTGGSMKAERRRLRKLQKANRKKGRGAK